MRRPIPIAPMASCFALTGFAVAIMSGLMSDVSSTKAIEGALIALFSCWVVGLAAGKACAAIGNEHMRDYTQTRPVPGFSPQGAGAMAQDAPATGFEIGAEDAPDREAA